MNTPQDDEISKRLHSIFPDPQTAAKVVDLVVPSKRPQGWSKRSYATYYNEYNARWLKSHIDKMIETKHDIVYRYDTWCQKGGMSEATLYNKINQSLRYLLDYMDKERIYIDWSAKTKISRTKGLGIEITFLAGDDLSPDFVIPKADLPLYKRKMDDWLESDEVKPFVLERLSLTKDEVISLRKELAGLQGIQASISSGAIRIIRMNQ